MLIIAALLSLIIGWLLGGRLSRIANCNLRMLFLPAAALLLRQVYLRPWTLVLSYLILFVFLFFNRHLLKSVILIGLGCLCNFTVIAANEFHMPVSQEALSVLSSSRADALLAGEIPMYSAINAQTRLAFLGDILPVKLPLFGGFASIGDILLVFGIFGFVMVIMAPDRFHKPVKKS